MRRRTALSHFSLRSLRRHANIVALLAVLPLLLFALLPRGYMPALAPAADGDGQVLAFVICQGATPGAGPLLPSVPGKAHDGSECPFAPLAGASLLFAHDAPVLAALPAPAGMALAPRLWVTPGLPFFPRPSGARAPPLSRA